MKKYTNSFCSALILAVLLLISAPKVFAQHETTGFTQADRDRLIRMEVILEQHEKRFESIDRRFEESRSDMNIRFGWLIGLFTAMTMSTIGFALWDRRTMIRPFETKVKEIDFAIEALQQETKASKIITALRELAKSDSKLAEILKNHNLL